MKKYWGVYCKETPESAEVLCEVDGEICYEAHATREEAEASAEEANARAKKFGHGSRYMAQIIPAGIKIFIAGEVIEARHAGKDREMCTIVQRKPEGWLHAFEVLKDGKHLAWFSYKVNAEYYIQAREEDK